jgi:subfamily B ATP-binding cassette protein MsbA
VERGTHQELIKKNGAYARLHQMQHRNDRKQAVVN